MLLVIVGHIFTEGMLDSDAKRAIYFFHMPLFLGIQGYLLAPVSVLEQLQKARARYLMPWAVASALYLVLLYALYDRQQYTVVEAILTPWYHLWFIPCLLAFSVIVCALRRHPVWAILLVFMVPIILRFARIDPMPLVGPIDSRYIYFGVFFALGYAVRAYGTLLPKWVPLAILSVGVIASAATFSAPLPIWQFDLFRVLLVFGAVGLVHHFPTIRAPRILAFFSAESLGIYLYHVAAILLVRELGLSGVEYWIAALLASGVAVPVLVALVRRTPAGDVLLGPARRVTPKLL